MKSKHPVLFIPPFLTVIILPLVFILSAIPSLFAKPGASPPKAQIPVSAAVMERQSLNACGPYAVRAVIHMLTEKFISAEKINAEMPLRLGDKTTLPPGLSLLLQTYGLATKNHWLPFNSNQSRLETLRAILNNGRPAILLVRDYGVQHYLTVTGYHDDSFCVYDSMMPLQNPASRVTVDANEYFSGNRDIHQDELIKLWSNGGMSLLFNFWCIEVYAPH